MRKAPAPGAEVAEVVTEVTHQTTGPAPDRGRCRKDARECARVSTQLTVVLLGPRCRAPPPSGPDPGPSHALDSRATTRGGLAVRLSRLPPPPMEHMAKRPLS